MGQVSFIPGPEPPCLCAPAVFPGPVALLVGLFIIHIPEHDILAADTHFPAFARRRHRASVLGRANGQFHALWFPDRTGVPRSVVRQGRPTHGVGCFTHGIRLEDGRVEGFFKPMEYGRAETAAT